MYRVSFEGDENVLKLIVMMTETLNVLKIIELYTSNGLNGRAGTR